MHFYSYGLKIKSISSRATTSSLSAKDAASFGFQGSFSEEVEDFDLNYNEFDLRTYDPQIGRWTTPDPYDEFASPYTGMGNDPINNVDPTGGFLGLSAVGSVAVATLGGAIVGTAVDIISGGDGTTGMAIGAGIGLLGGGISLGTSSFASAASIFGSGIAIGGDVYLKQMNSNSGINISRQASSFRSSVSQQNGHGPNINGYEQTETGVQSLTDPIESQVNDLIQSGDYGGVLRLIIKSYPDIYSGMQENVDYYIEDDPSQMLNDKNLGWGFLTPDEKRPLKYNRNGYQLLPTIYTNLYTYVQYKKGEITYGGLVRRVFHEMVHARLMRGKLVVDGVKWPANPGTIGENQAIHESVAHYLTLKNTTLPSATERENRDFANSGCENFGRLNSKNKALLSRIINFFANIYNNFFLKH